MFQRVNTVIEEAVCFICEDSDDVIDEVNITDIFRISDTTDEKLEYKLRKGLLKNEGIIEMCFGCICGLELVGHNPHKIKCANCNKIYYAVLGEKDTDDGSLEEGYSSNSGAVAPYQERPYEIRCIHCGEEYLDRLEDLAFRLGNFEYKYKPDVEYYTEDTIGTYFKNR